MVIQIEKLKIKPDGQTISLKVNAINQTPIFGGEVVRLASLGDRFTASFTAYDLTYSQGVSVETKLKRGITERIRSYIIQPKMNIPNSNPLYQSGYGREMVCKNATPNVTFPNGAYFNVMQNVTINGVTETRAYLHQLTEDCTSNSSGNVTLKFIPSLRKYPQANAVIQFIDPVIEGYIGESSYDSTTGDTKKLSISYTITETN